MTSEQASRVTIHYAKRIAAALNVALPQSRAEKREDAEVREEVLAAV